MCGSSVWSAGRSFARGIFGGGGGEQQRRPQICPACGALVGISATRCHVCGTSLRFSLAAFSKKFSGVFGEHDAPVTSVLLIMNFVMLGVSWLAYAAIGRGGGLTFCGGCPVSPNTAWAQAIGPAIFFLNEWWRLVTAMFLHGGLLHIGFNMMALMQFGPAIEELYGSARYLFIYVFTGAFGFLASAYFGQFFAGGERRVARPCRRDARGDLKARRSVHARFAFAADQRGRHSVRLGFSGFMAMDNWAHGGGLLAGFVLGKLFADRQPNNANERRRAYALGWLGGLVVVASFALMIKHYRDPTPFSQQDSSMRVERCVSADSATSPTSGGDYCNL